MRTPGGARAPALDWFSYSAPRNEELNTMQSNHTTTTDLVDLDALPEFDSADPGLDLGVQELDDLVAPGWGSWVAGIGGGAAAGYGAVALGAAIAT
ncbi:hypothetical protein [Patulibacter sp.]|uniref:hypothetical protein n=1 Tax=Patulibacter sp. TaxID=1912859 RepID=UPI00272AB86D|nr:hypothetical protein [Patulibacter sp.]